MARTEVDFVVVGSGAAGGVIARELSKAGLSVVVLEQGPWRKAEQFNRAAQRDMVLMHQRQGKGQQSVNARGTGRCRAEWLGFGIAVNRHMV